MSTAAILYPVLAQVALTFVLLFVMGPARFAAVRRGDVRIKDIALGQSAWPDRVQQLSNSLDNQFQLPVLFYVLVGFLLITRMVDPLLVGLAWIFVASRFAHAYIHVTTNDVPYRFWSYVVGLLALVAMWIAFAVRIAVEGV